MMMVVMLMMVLMMVMLMVVSMAMLLIGVCHNPILFCKLLQR